jgi:ankyrin repeat protein
LTLILSSFGLALLGQGIPQTRLTFRDPRAVELKKAILAGNLELVQKLAGSFSTNDCLELDEEGRTALHYATRQCAIDNADPQPFEILKLLALRSSCLNVPDRLGRKPILELDPLSWANRSRMDALEILVNAGADVNAQNENGATLLHQVLSTWDATSLHLPDVLQLFLKAKANMNLQDSSGQTPLHCFFGRRGFESNREASRATRIAAAQKIFTMLVDGGADLTIRDQEGTTPLGDLLAEYEVFFGAKENILEFMAPGLSKRLNVNGAVIKNRPALIFLCDKGKTDPDLIERLLELSADPKKAEQDGFTALHGAAWFYNFQSCALLLQHGASANALNSDGRTALHELARSRYGASGFFETDHSADVLKTAEVLIAGGADRRLKDKDGKTAFDLLKNLDESAWASSDSQEILRGLKKRLKPK